MTVTPAVGYAGHAVRSDCEGIGHVHQHQSGNGKPGQRHAELTDAQVEARLVTATDAFRSWRDSELAMRTALLGRIADAFEKDKDRLGRIATEETGKPLKSAIAEIEKCGAAFHYYAKHGPRLLEPAGTDTPAGHASARWLPMGPVLAVMPWNFPYWQVIRFAAPTIMAGNVGLLKQASSVQGCATAIEATILMAGAPEGVFQNLPIRSDRIAGLIADDRVVAVTLTGSEGAGMNVAEAAGKALKKVVLELGGSDPFVVMPSADIDLAAKTAVTARVQNSGQSCICAKRMIVHADVYDAFMDRFAAGMKAVKTGDPMDPDTEMGPLSSEDQRDIVIGQLAKFRDAGAAVIWGGEARPARRLTSPPACWSTSIPRPRWRRRKSSDPSRWCSRSPISTKRSRWRTMCRLGWVRVCGPPIWPNKNALPATSRRE